MIRLKNKYSQGFTLLEILIAILLFSIVIVLLFATFKAFILSSDRVKNDLVENHQVTFLFRRLSQDLQMIHVAQTPGYKKPDSDSEPDPYRLFGTKENTDGVTPVSRVEFASFSHAQLYPGARQGLARLVYYLRPDKTGTFDLCRSDDLIPADDPVSSCSDPVLLKQVTGFDITYYDTAGDEYEYWDSDQSAFAYQFPAVIGFKIKIKMGQDVQRVETRFSIIPARSKLD